jgi:hypothetical protein
MAANNLDNTQNLIEEYLGLETRRREAGENYLSGKIDRIPSNLAEKHRELMREIKNNLERKSIVTLYNEYKNLETNNHVIKGIYEDVLGKKLGWKSNNKRETLHSFIKKWANAHKESYNGGSRKASTRRNRTKRSRRIPDLNKA